MRTSITDLNNLLFEQIERITNDDLSEEELDREVKRVKAVTDIAKTIVDNNRVAVDALKYLEPVGSEHMVDLKFLGGE